VFAFLALAAIAKFSNDGNYPSKNKNNRRASKRTTLCNFWCEISF
jgi:hypothetical protein